MDQIKTGGICKNDEWTVTSLTLRLKELLTMLIIPFFRMTSMDYSGLKAE